MDISHPPFDRLADLTEGLLDVDDERAVLGHLATCSRCSDDVDWLTHAIGLMRGDETVSAPEHVLNRAVRLLRQRRNVATKGEPDGLIKRLKACIRFDSANATPAFGLRVGGDEPTRQRLFEARPYELELRTRATRGGWSLVGQLLGPADSVASGEVELIGADTSVHARMTELLEFSLPAVPAGTYRLKLHLDQSTEIDIPPLEVGPHNHP